MTLSPPPPPSCISSLYDINNDGFITADEMRQVVGAIYRLIDAAQSDHVSPEQRGQDLFAVSDGADIYTGLPWWRYWQGCCLAGQEPGRSACSERMNHCAVF